MVKAVNKAEGRTAVVSARRVAELERVFMPFIKSAGKLIYFAHVPKCGGAAVEEYLRARFGTVGFADERFDELAGALHWSRSSARHVPAAILDRLFPPGFFDAAFAVVRHPVDRLVSEYHFLRDVLKRIDRSESFATWLAHIDRAIAENPWRYDNHLRPMADLVPGDATIFRLEEGLEPIIPYLDGLVGASDRPLGFGRVLTRDPSIPKVVPGLEEIATIERLYRQDFERFGYPMQGGAPVARAAPPDRSALAAEFRDEGIACLRDGDIAWAHAQFRFALNCAPDDAQIHAMIANTALRLGSVHLALGHATAALERQPDNLDALVALAGARLRLKDPEARDSIAALAPFEQLGDFRHLLRMAVAAAEGDYEATLFELADYLEAHPQDVLAGELLSETFGAFRDGGDTARFGQFLDGVGVLADPPARAALDKPMLGQVACVDIIIPVYDGLESLKVCLASIRRWHSTAMRQIILVDDCSSAETASWLDDYQARHSDVRLFRNAENLGFTRAVMAGVQQSNAAYMLFLNSDTQVTAQWLEGLLEAIHAGPNNALAGPLSNNGFHQTICPSTKMGTVRPNGRSPDDIAAFVRSTTQKAFPRVPFLSGFCLLIHRGAFETAGGLDCEAFPHGYWEVQDLCLKLTDLGFDSVIADHVYVHHEGGGSIAGSRRESLTNTGRARMYDRHSALRVLIAEAVSALEPEIAWHRHVWVVQDQIAQILHLPAPSSIAQPRMLGPVGRICMKEPISSVDGCEVCLFVMHCPLGAPSEYTLVYLDELKRAGLLVIVCLAVEDLSIPIADSLMELADAMLLRENGGYDFGAWADLLRRFPQVWSAERLYFVNDSILGPFGSLGPIIQSIRDRDAGFFALSESTQTQYHAQSFFFGWNRVNLASPLLREFWAGISNLRDKEAVILNYEFGIGPLSGNLPDLSQHVVFGFQQILGSDPSELLGVNPTHIGWRRLLAAGFPFVKTDLLRDGVPNLECGDWEVLCAAHGADVAAMHRSLETSRLNRLPRPPKI